jgi:hypothetical protein
MQSGVNHAPWQTLRLNSCQAIKAFQESRPCYALPPISPFGNEHSEQKDESGEILTFSRSTGAPAGTSTASEHLCPINVSSVALFVFPSRIAIGLDCSSISNYAPTDSLHTRSRTRSSTGIQTNLEAGYFLEIFDASVVKPFNILLSSVVVRALGRSLELSGSNACSTASSGGL